MKNSLGYFAPHKTRFTRLTESVMIQEMVKGGGEYGGVELLVKRKRIFEDFVYPMKLAVT